MTVTVGRAMTAAIHRIGPRDTLVRAKELMQMHAIRHLPVVEETKVVGMVTLSDLYVMEAVVQADPEKTFVEDAMSREVYVVVPEEPLANVARHMAEHHLGSAIVLEGDRLVGIFTGVDACRMLGEVLTPAAK